MNKFAAKKYYERPDIQEAILSFAKNREIGVRYDGYFGKRPDVIEFISDVREFVKRGVFSFHMSEERWENPLLLGNDKLTEEERAKNRVGWDLILDLDGVDFVYSKFLAKVILEYFDSIGIKNVSIKFSGNKGFHIGIPFEAFSKQSPGLVAGISETRLLFPDVAKRTVLFLLHELKSTISKMILEHEGGGQKAINKISKKYSIDIEDLKYDEEKDEFDFMKVIDIDTILITSRHLFRMPYSLNEKSGLVSVPIPKSKLMQFEKHWAKPERIKPEYDKNHMFLKFDAEFGQDGNVLLDKVYSDTEYMYDESIKDIEKKSKSSNLEFVISEKIDIKDFPRTIQHVLKSDFEDGRKRALFLLMTFLSCVNWEYENAEELVTNWNDKLSKPLKKQYLQAQLSWFKNQEKKISPPNYDNTNYYSSIGIPKDVLDEDINKFRNKKVKNPLHYIFLVSKRGKKK